MTTIGTNHNPLRVAIIGSGPSGFYAAEHLQKQKDLTIEIDMYERLPTPYGLVRGGVAPDHQKIKSVTKVYDRIAAHPSFRWYGNVTFGQDITRADLERYYHAIIYAVGAQSDKPLGIPGEDLPGSHAATEFVGWYNGHPDYRDLSFDLSVERAIVVGVGNVAMDVVRILARTVDELRTTDIADHALDALAQSRVREIIVLGRRGPAQAAFTNPEIKELGEMADADILAYPEEVALDDFSRAYLAEQSDRTAARNVEILQAYAARPPMGKSRRIIMRFLVSPIEILGQGRVEAVKIVKNQLVKDARGDVRPQPTEHYETIPAGLIFRSVGYYGQPLPDLPFYDKWGIIPNSQGRVLKEYGANETLDGHYVVGWIKRGPSGVIGTNKPDAVETVEHLLEDWRANRLLMPPAPARAELEAYLRERKPNYITYADWQTLDALEVKQGAAMGRPRRKFTRVAEMLDALAMANQPDPIGD